MKKTYMGIPRNDIPWCPTIDPEKCTTCGTCAEFCPNGVFEVGDDGIMKVKTPMNCVVGCDKCGPECPTGAITFPNKEQLLTWIKEIRNKREKNKAKSG